MQGGHRRLTRVDRAVMEALLPAEADPNLPLGALESGFEDFLDEFDRDAAPNLRTGFRIALFVAGWLAPLMIRRPPPLSHLVPADRERALAAMADSRLLVLRQLVVVLKTVAALHYGAVPEVRRAIGYHA